MGSGSSTAATSSSLVTSNHSSEKYKINSQNHQSVNLLTPQNVNRAKRGSFFLPKISSQHFTPEMVGDYISKLSTWNEGFGYEGEVFMSHMKFLDYRTRFIENEIDGSAILTLKTQRHVSDLLNELQILDENHRQRIQSAFDDLRHHLLQSIHVVRYEDFISLPEFPRCPDNSSIIHDLIDIDLSKSFIIFVSHCWLRGYPGAEGYSHRPHPDNARHEKYQLCLEGIQKILQSLTDSSLECYIWMDYSCIHQDSNPAGELEHLDEIVKYSDCIFTPIVDNSVWEYIHTNEGDFYDYKATGWCQGEHSYIERAWCRIEMFYAANVPLSKHVKTKLPSLKYGLKSALENHRRPHFLYGTRESRLSLNPIQLQPLCKEYSFFDKYHPCKGSVTMQRDLLKIQQLVDELKPYLSYRLPVSSAFPSPLVTSRKLPSNLIAHSRIRHLTTERKVNRDQSPRENKSHSITSSPLSTPTLRKKLNSPLSPVRSSSPLRSEQQPQQQQRTSPAMLSPIMTPSSPSISLTTSLNSSTPIPTRTSTKTNDLDLPTLVQRSVSNVTIFNSHDDSKTKDKDKSDQVNDCDSLHSSRSENEEDDDDDGDDVEILNEATHDKLVVSVTNTSQTSALPPTSSQNSTLPSVVVGDILKISSNARRTRDVNGCIYHGQYKGNDRHGCGQLQYPNGDIFEGLFKHNVIHGKGKYTYGNGDTFVGEWRSGYRHGKGIHTISDGEVIQELYRNGHKIKGKFIYPDYVYIGSLNKDGMKDGQCIVRYNSGDTFEGKYVNDQREGYGKYFYANGDVYEGHYHHNLRHGSGKFTSQMGDIFTGEYKYDKKDCESGTYITATGDVIIGQWKNNQKHGKFKIKYHNGETYNGDYRNNKKHGRGVYVYSNTESYTGEYRDGKKHGQGTYRFLNGQEKRGLWSNDILTENSLSGNNMRSRRGLSMKSICNEQNEKEDQDVVSGFEEETMTIPSSPFNPHHSISSSASIFPSPSSPSSSSLTAAAMAVSWTTKNTPLPAKTSRERSLTTSLASGSGNDLSLTTPKSPQRIRKTTSLYAIPTSSSNRGRSSSEGSEGSVVTLHRHSPSRGKL